MSEHVNTNSNGSTTTKIIRKPTKFQHLTSTERLKRLKVTVVGDGNVGKTSLLMTYTISRFPEEYLPTVFDTHPTHIKVDTVEYPVVLWDTAGQEEYARLRPLSYPKTDCFIVCYAVDNPSSLSNVKNLWIPEVRKYCPKAAVILVGTKLDLKDSALNPVPSSEAKKLKNKLDVQAFLECSARTKENLDEVFVQAIIGILRKRNHKQFTCVSL